MSLFLAVSWVCSVVQLAVHRTVPLSSYIQCLHSCSKVNYVWVPTRQRKHKSSEEQSMLYQSQNFQSYYNLQLSFLARVGELQNEYFSKWISQVFCYPHLIKYYPLMLATSCPMIVFAKHPQNNENSTPLLYLALSCLF